MLMEIFSKCYFFLLKIEQVNCHMRLALRIFEHKVVKEEMKGGFGVIPGTRQLVIMEFLLFLL